MISVRKKIIQALLPFLDLSVTAASFILAYFIKKYFLPVELRGLSIEPNYYLVLSMVLALWYMVHGYFGFVIPTNREKLRISLANVVKATIVGFIAVVFLIFVFKIREISRIMMGLFLVISITALLLERLFLYFTIKKYLNSRIECTNVLIIGSLNRARDVIECLYKKDLERYSILGCLDIDPNRIGAMVSNGVKVIGHILELKKFLLKGVVDEIIFALPMRLVNHPNEYLSLSEEMGVSVRILPDWQIYGFKPKVATPRFDNLPNLPTLLLSTITCRHSEYALKVVFDYLAAAGGIVLLSPLFAVIAIAIKVFSPGPVFFRQERIGLHGRKFYILKFRTMCIDAEKRKKELKTLNESDGPVFKIKDDPRIIPHIGKFLRRTNLDELPQLFNVLKGEMSIVGPRPPVLDEVEQYDIWQRRRLSMKPGLTCMWQVSLSRNDISFNDWMNMDLRYIDTWSLGLDIQLIAKTIRIMVMGTGR